MPIFKLAVAVKCHAPDRLGALRKGVEFLARPPAM